MAREHSMDSRFYPPPEGVILDSGPLTEAAGFALLGSDLGEDVESAIQDALSGGAVFPEGDKPLFIFRRMLASSIRDIQSHPRGRLLQEFLLKGPFEDTGVIPTDLARQRILDTDAATAITFIYSFMVNSFKGAVTELLAAKACSRLLCQLKQGGYLPRNARLYVGDSVMVLRQSGNGASKGADLHMLVTDSRGDTAPSIMLAGVAEVKSGRKSADAMSRQLDGHVLRAKRGLCVSGVHYPADKVRMGQKADTPLLRITVQPSDWKLPRTFQFKNSKHGRLLHVDAALPPVNDDVITNLGDGRWHIALKWSKEAIAQAAYEMTFWYMEKVGEIIYADPSTMPKKWREMTPAEAGRNAVKMMLYYAILRCRGRIEQRAIALYNSYGYGYSLGMNYKNAKGRREMLWPQDLDEILSVGKTKNGSTLR